MKLICNRFDKIRKDKAKIFFLQNIQKISKNIVLISVFIPLHLCSCLCFAFYICFPAFRRAGYGYYYFFKYNIMI